ncbi:hypothetical protein M9H77_27085 [Catharanthus roseus]|uniref:Uncharacterized protein n=1 Tax=Catharanthus roseus TaxID=4058 RepID=A0ACC0AE71_CATRO|nr:hypothetical protein M9H77_27085 [Catharanthus roseus]
MMILVLSWTRQVEFMVALSHTSDLLSTTTPLPTGLHYDTGAPGFSAQLSPVLFRSQPHIPSHLSLAQESLTEFSGPARQLGAEFFEQMLGASNPTVHIANMPFMGMHFSYLRFEDDRGLDEEPDKVRSLHIGGEEDERADDGGGDDDDDDDDDDDGEDAGDEEQPVTLALVAPASGSDGRRCHGKRKRLTDSFMSVMSKTSRSCNKRPDKACDASDWEQIGPAEGGPVDPKFIPSYSGYVAGPIWRGQVLIFILILNVKFFLNFFFVVCNLATIYIQCIFFYDLLCNI